MITSDPTILTLGEFRPTLTCVVPGLSDGYDIIWEKNGRVMAGDTETIMLLRLTQFDEGHYTCRQKIGRWYHPRSPPYTLTRKFIYILITF